MGQPNQSFDLDRVLYHFNGTEDFTIRHACEGVQIFGGIGSGKTSGSGAALAKSFLRAGFGGLVLCAKKDELATWLKYAYESAAYNLCDCISGTDFEQVQSIVDKVKAMKKDIEDPEERIQQLPEEERRAWDVFASCGFIPTGEFMERRIYDSSRDSMEYYFEKTCPYLKARFMAINNDFE